ncbi:hypothetical protein AB0F91_34745 [Amycolatopsis sp. NPDC023774]|uniref:hypothetical protein n=1 Tax=Amycolatopsis sp. NPDC023774 TaxID=3155015 RepID=UPI0033CBFDF1
MLSFLPDRDIDEYLGRVDLTQKWGPADSAGEIRARITRTRKTGYSLNAGLVVGAAGIWPAPFSVAPALPRGRLP